VLDSETDFEKFKSEQSSECILKLFPKLRAEFETPLHSMALLTQ